VPSLRPAVGKDSFLFFFEKTCAVSSGRLTAGKDGFLFF
jgi:hypothetical protein